MMEYIYPTFGYGRIMKKELLWALRDYSYSALQLQYRNYPDGIISGCKVQVEEDILHIAPGIIKCQEFVFLLSQGGNVKYEPTGVCTSLKFRLVDKERLEDYTRYRTEIVLDEQIERKQNEIEICRFKLKKGAKLRVGYKDFYDVQTEYDTVNLANATWSAVEANTLSKEITDYFARMVLECENADCQDVNFAYYLLQSKEAVNYEVLNDYIARRTGNKTRKSCVSTEEAFWLLEGILDKIRRGIDSQEWIETEIDQKMIVLD